MYSLMSKELDESLYKISKKYFGMENLGYRVLTIKQIYDDISSIEDELDLNLTESEEDDLIEKVYDIYINYDELAIEKITDEFYLVIKELVLREKELTMQEVLNMNYIDFWEDYCNY